MNVDWNTNWAPTIVTILSSGALTFLSIWLPRKWGVRRGPPSENIEATYPEGTTQKFKGVKTYSKRNVEIKPEGDRKFSEEVIQFEGQEGISSISAEEIQDILKKLTEQIEDSDNMNLDDEEP